MEEGSLGVYHASEADDIEVFVPRRYWHIGFERSGSLDEGMIPPDGSQVIQCFYGSSDWYVPFYFAPKVCPRLFVCRRKSSTSFDRLAEILCPLSSDRVMFFRSTDQVHLERHRFTVYQLPAKPFERLPNGEFIARESIKPIDRQTFTNVVRSLDERGYQLVFVPDIEEMRTRLLRLGLTVDSEAVRIVG